MKLIQQTIFYLHAVSNLFVDALAVCMHPASMFTIEIQIEEGGATHRCMQALCALYPGVTAEAIAEYTVETAFEQAAEDFDLLQTYGDGAVEQLDIQRARERRLRRQFDAVRRGRKLRTPPPLQSVKAVA